MKVTTKPGGPGRRGIPSYAELTILAIIGRAPRLTVNSAYLYDQYEGEGSHARENTQVPLKSLIAKGLVRRVIVDDTANYKDRCEYELTNEGRRAIDRSKAFYEMLVSRLNESVHALNKKDTYAAENQNRF